MTPRAHDIYAHLLRPSACQAEFDSQSLEVVPKSFDSPLVLVLWSMYLKKRAKPQTHHRPTTPAAAIRRIHQECSFAWEPIGTSSASDGAASEHRNHSSIFRAQGSSAVILGSTAYLKG